LIGIFTLEIAGGGRIILVMALQSQLKEMFIAEVLLDL
jgi:hypothetical protein